MELEANASADVTLLSQTLYANVHARVALPRNLFTLVRCLRGSHDGDDDCSVMDHIDVVELDVDLGVN